MARRLEYTVQRLSRSGPMKGAETPGLLDETLTQLRSYVAARVAPYKRLHEVRVVAELPRLPSGKLLRRVLRDRERDPARPRRRSSLRRLGLVAQTVEDARRGAARADGARCRSTR